TTITLAQGRLELSGAGSATITIDASAISASPTAPGITISGNGLSRVFQIDSGVTAIFNNLNIFNGFEDGTNNTNNDPNPTKGGGIFNAGNLTLSACQSSTNQVLSAVPGGIAEGGGIFNTSTATLTVTNNTQLDGTVRGGNGATG